MEQSKEHVSRALLTSAASETNAEAFRRAIRASNSKIDAQLMIRVFRSLDNSRESTGQSGLRKRRGVSNPGEVSVDAVVAEYAKGMLERNRSRTRRTLADYVELGAGLTSEMLDAEKIKERGGGGAREGSARGGVQPREEVEALGRE